MRVLLVISEVPPTVSGVARFAERLRQGLQARGHIVTTVSSVDMRRISLGEVRLTSAPLWWIRPPVALEAYDIIDIHGPVPTFSDAALMACGLSRRKQRPRVVYTHHWEVDLPNLSALCWLYNMWHRWMARAADHVVVTTPSYAQLFPKQRHDSRLSIIPGGGVDVTTFAEAAPRSATFTVLFVGQLRPYKGLDVLLRAMTMVPDVRLVIVGSGPKKSEYEELARRLGLRHCEFRGNLPDSVLAGVFGQSHVVVVPSVSRLEAFGIVLLEGMAAGCVPVASDLPGVRDVALPAGFTFPVGDWVALAEVLRCLSNSRKLWSERAKLARHWAGEFPWLRSVDAHVDLCEALVSGERQIHPLNTFPRLESIEGCLL